MGMPSASIYINELIQSYDVKRLIRVGTCGALSTDVHVRDLVIAQGAVTTTGIIKRNFPYFDFAPIADFHLMKNAYDIAVERGVTTHVGNILSEDSFYKDYTKETLELAKYGVKGVEMEAAVLYYLGAKFNVETLAICTVSDHIITGEETTSEERQTSFNEMIEIGLETAIK